MATAMTNKLQFKLSNDAAFCKICPDKLTDTYLVL